MIMDRYRKVQWNIGTSRAPTCAAVIDGNDDSALLRLIVLRKRRSGSLLFDVDDNCLKVCGRFKDWRTLCQTQTAQHTMLVLRHAKERRWRPSLPERVFIIKNN